MVNSKITRKEYSMNITILKQKSKIFEMQHNSPMKILIKELKIQK